MRHQPRYQGLGVYLRYRHDGSLFNLHRLESKTKVVDKIILEALFADDCALMAHKESDLQLITDKFAEASLLSGLTIRRKAPTTNPDSFLALTAPASADQGLT
ncbi:hypothetical protein SNE40_018229 [Patella caerulea]|uniref:Uncharacterized protein n=1 Tax=Patella caerulea TaxID=87958 RepID=A0AAN8JAB7_PATCE